MRSDQVRPYRVKLFSECAIPQMRFECITAYDLADAWLYAERKWKTAYVSIMGIEPAPAADSEIVTATNVVVNIDGSKLAEFIVPHRR